MTCSTNSTPADIQRQIDDEDLCHVLLEHAGMESYSDALNFAGGSGHGRIGAMLWQAIFQHLLIRRRNMCIQAQLNFYETEKKCEAAVKRLKTEVSPQLAWMLVYAQTMKITISESAMWDRATGTLRSWPGRQ